jgi:hypothetical protein
MLLCYLTNKPVTFGDYFSCVSHAVSVVTVAFFVYERWLWRYIPWKRPPVLKKHYNGSIIYTEDTEVRTKEIVVSVKQSLFSVSVQTKTDINASYSITATINMEHGIYFLYYSYITNPNAIVMEGNPIQYGTCRMALQKDTSTLKGKYWNTSRRNGDISWFASVQ